MSDAPLGDGWWIASDGKWYAPELHPDAPDAPGAPPPPAPSTFEPPPTTGSPTVPPPAPLAPHQKKRNWVKIAAIVLVGLVGLIVGCTALIFTFARGPIDAANEFLADVAADDFNAAVDHLDASCFGAGDASPTALRNFFGDGVTSYDLTSTSNQNNATGEASGSITRDGFGTQSISFAMTKPADDWLICGFRIDS